MEVEIMTREAITRALLELRAQISALPFDLPEDVYSLHDFAFDRLPSHLEDKLEDLGKNRLLNLVLERQIAPKGRINGVALRGRGRGLEAVVDLLEECTHEFPNDVVLQKWIPDLTDAAKRLIAVRIHIVICHNC
jgi:hypothetical protein